MKLIALTFLLFWSSIGLSQVKIPVDSAGFMRYIDYQGNSLSHWILADQLDKETYPPYVLFKRNKQWGICDSNLVDIGHGLFDKIEKSGDHLFAKRGETLAFFDENIRLINTIEGIHSYEVEQNSYDATHLNTLIVKGASGYGIVNIKGEWLLQPDYGKTFYTNGVVYLRKGDHFGFFSLDEEVLIEPKWSAIGQFNAYTVELWDESRKKTYYFTDGRKLPASDSILVIDSNSGFFKVYQNGKGELYNSDLKPIIQYHGDDIFPINKNKWNRRGIYTEVAYKREWDFAIKRNQKIGCISSTGQQILSFQYDYVDGVGEGLYHVMKNGKHGVVDRFENVIIPISYTYVLRDRDYFRVYDFDKKGLTDLKGQIIVPPKFDELRVERYGVITKLEGKHGFYTFDGHETLRPKFLVYLDGDDIRFESEDGVCMVGKDGLITPVNCDFISRKHDLVKYYVGDKIVMHNLKDDRILDTTVYPLQRSIRKQYNVRKHALLIHEDKFAQFHDQLTGKIGSIRKEGDGFAVRPRYFNVFYDHTYGGMGLVKEHIMDTVRLDEVSLIFKEILIPFYYNNGSVGHKLLSVQSRGTSGWSSTELDPVMKLNRKWTYRSKNDYQHYEVPFINRRRGPYSEILLEGDMNFKTGTDLMRYQDYYKQLNEYHNMILTDRRSFDQIIDIKSVKVDEPLWRILKTRINTFQYDDLGHFTYFEITSNQKAIVKEDIKGYGVLLDKGDYLILPEASHIKPVMLDGYEYFIVNREKTSLASGVSESVIEVYDSEGLVLSSDYPIEVVAPGYFKIIKNGVPTIVNKNNEVIYICQ